jgi:hypothetical protein
MPFVGGTRVACKARLQTSPQVGPTFRVQSRGGRTIRLEKILVPLDGSILAASAVAKAAGLAIMEAARLRDSDPSVMRPLGWNRLGRLILGSVADSMLCGTTMPILLLGACEAQSWPRGMV